MPYILDIVERNGVFEVVELITFMENHVLEFS